MNMSLNSQAPKATHAYRHRLFHTYKSKIIILMFILYLLVNVDIYFTQSVPTVNPKTGQIIVQKPKQTTYMILGYKSPNINNTIYGIIIKCNSTAGIQKSRQDIINKYEKEAEAYQKAKKSGDSKTINTYVENVLNNLQNSKNGITCEPMQTGKLTFNLVDANTHSLTPIPGCEDVNINGRVNINGKNYPSANCTVDLSNPPFSFGCKDVIITTKNLPAFEGDTIICPPEKVSEMPLGNFKSALHGLFLTGMHTGVCLFGGILFVLLLTSMYLRGKNPLMLLDLTVPKTPKPKGWTMISPVTTPRSYGELNKTSTAVRRSIGTLAINELRRRGIIIKRSKKPYKREKTKDLEEDTAVLTLINEIARKYGISPVNIRRVSEMSAVEFRKLGETVNGILKKLKNKARKDAEERDYLLAMKMNEYIAHRLNSLSMVPMSGQLGPVSSFLVKTVNLVFNKVAGFNKLGKHVGSSVLYFPGSMIRTAAIGGRMLSGTGMAMLGTALKATKHIKKGNWFERQGNALLRRATPIIGRLYPVLNKLGQTYIEEHKRLMDMLIMMTMKEEVLKDQKLKDNFEKLLKSEQLDAFSSKETIEAIEKLIKDMNDIQGTNLEQILGYIKEAYKNNKDSQWIYEQMMNNPNIQTNYDDIYFQLKSTYKSNEEDYVKALQLYSYEYYGPKYSQPWIERLPILDRENMGGRNINEDLWTNLIFGNLLHKYREGYTEIGIGDSLAETFFRMFNYTFGLGIRVENGRIKINSSGYSKKDERDLERFVSSKLSVDAIRVAVKAAYQNLTDTGKRRLAQELKGIYSTTQLDTLVDNGKLSPSELVNVLYQIKDVEQTYKLHEEGEEEFITHGKWGRIDHAAYLNSEDFGAERKGRIWKTDMSGLWHKQFSKREAYTAIEQVFNKIKYGKYGLGQISQEIIRRMQAKGITKEEEVLRYSTESLALNFLNGTLYNLYDGQFRRRIEFDKNAVVGMLAHLTKYGVDQDGNELDEATRQNLGNEIMQKFENSPTSPGLNIEKVYSKLVDGEYAVGKTDREILLGLERVLRDENISTHLKHHIDKYNVSYMDTVHNPYAGLNEGTFVPITKGIPLSDYDLVVGAELAIKGRNGRYYQFDPNSTNINYGRNNPNKKRWESLYQHIINEAEDINLRKSQADTLITELTNWLNENGISNKEYLRRAYTVGKVIHNLSETLNDPSLLNRGPLSLRGRPEVKIHTEGNIFRKVQISMETRWKNILRAGFAPLINRTLYAVSPLMHGLVQNVAMSEVAREISYNNMMYLASMRNEDWNKIGGGEFRNELMSTVYNYFRYHVSWANVIDRDPRNASTAPGIQNALSGFFNFGPSRNFPLAMHEKLMQTHRLKWWYTRYIEYPLSAEYAGHKLSTLTNTFRTIQQAMQGYPGRYDIANPNNPFMARGYYTPIRMGEALAAFNPFTIDESDELRNKYGKLKKGVFIKAGLSLFFPLLGGRTRQIIFRTAGYKLDKLLGLRNPAEEADLAGINMMKGLRQSPLEIMHIYSGADANARVGDANPGVSYYNPYHRLEPDTNVSQYLAYEFGRYERGGAKGYNEYFKGFEDFYAKANRPIIKRDTKITAETLHEYREYELRQFGLFRNPVYGWLSPLLFIWHNPIVSNISGRVVFLGAKNLFTKEGRMRIKPWLGRERVWLKNLPYKIGATLNPSKHMVRYCPVCGTPIYNGSVCPRCGHDLGKLI